MRPGQTIAEITKWKNLNPPRVTGPAGRRARPHNGPGMIKLVNLSLFSFVA
jgi:hypothetical protein